MKKYIFLTAIFSVSVIGAWLLPINEIFKGVFATPAVLAMIGVLYQLLRDESLYLKNLELQRHQQVFQIGAISHMANVAFDKHVEFCEKYMSEVHETVSTLFREGPSAKALDHARRFAQIKQEYAAWVTDEVASNLDPFEQALREIGAMKGYIQDVSGDPNESENRKAAIREVRVKFNSVLTIENEQPDEHVAIEAVKTKIRKILDIEDLVLIRKKLIYQAGIAVGAHNKRLQIDAATPRD